MASVDAPSATIVDSLPFIDMTTLSQSELHSLSLISSSHLRRTVPDSVVSPAIDRSSFNESAGSRRQTYSRPSPHHHHHHHRHRLAALLPKSSISAGTHPPNPNSEDPERLENRSIIKCLKQLLSSHPEFQQPDFAELDCFNTYFDFAPPTEAPVTHGGFPVEVRKRKRGRRPKVKALAGFEREREMVGVGVVNSNGVVVDLIALASLEDPYREELKRRTQGLQNEEELLGFLRDLDGQWCSRRRKRKFVDASEFGNTLPVGWKLLLGLKRKEGRAWVYCRRYISPGGEQFISCKDVSEYLQKMSGDYITGQQKNDVGENVQCHNQANTRSHTGVGEVDYNHGQLNENKKEMTLIGIDNLSEVQIHDLFECHICNTSFDERDSYLQHLSSFHQTTRSMKGTEESPPERMASPQKIDSLKDELALKISKMDALIEIAQNSIRESSSGPNDESNCGLSYTKETKENVSNPKLFVGTSDYEVNSDSPLSEAEVGDVLNCRSTELELRQETAGNMIIDRKIENTAGIINDIAVGRHPSSVKVKDGHISEIPSPASSNSQKVICTANNIIGTDGVDHSKHDVVDKEQTIEVEVDFGINSCVRDEVGQQETVQQYCKEYATCNAVFETPSSLSQPPDLFPIPNATSAEQGNGIVTTNERNGKTGFEELRIEDIDQLKYNYGSGGDPVFLHEMEIDVENNNVNDAANCSSSLFESDDVDATGRQHLRALCVWCGMEFINDALDAELLSDSVGYMCPTCKAKTSGQIDMIGTGYS